jgi:hypothetical protein
MEEHAPGIFYAATASLMVYFRNSNSYRVLVQAICRLNDAFPKASCYIYCENVRRMKSEVVATQYAVRLAGMNIL